MINFSCVVLVKSILNGEAPYTEKKKKSWCSDL